MLLMSYLFATGLGNAIVNGTIVVQEAIDDWREEGVNPLDTIKVDIERVLNDSTITESIHHDEN